MSSITPDNKVFVVGSRPRAHCVSLSPQCLPALSPQFEKWESRASTTSFKLQLWQNTTRRAEKLIYSRLRFLIRKRDYLSRSIGRIWGFGRSSSADDSVWAQKIEMIGGIERARAQSPIGKGGQHAEVMSAVRCIESWNSPSLHLFRLKFMAACCFNC